MRVSVIIPTHNEAGAIERVLADLPSDLATEVIVVDSSSTDGTPEIAARMGSRVIQEPRRGYGRACLTGLAAANSPDVVVFLDGDYSDRPSELPILLAPIIEGRADITLGSRLHSRTSTGALPWHQVFGNRLAARLIRFLYGLNISDLGPFRAARADVLRALALEEPTYGWAVEMILKGALAGFRVVEVPVSYYPRIGKSKISGTLKGTIGAGWFILSLIVRYYFRRRRAPHRSMERFVPPVKMRVWMTWSELTDGPRITKDEFQAQLAKYPKTSILIACTKLSVGLGYGPGARTVPPDNVTDLHIPILFPPSLAPQVSRWFHQEGRIPFFGGQVRYLAAETLRRQPLHPVPEIPENGPENDQFGELLLKSGELLYKKHIVVGDELDGHANIAAEFLPTYEITSATEPLFSFSRFYIWLTKIIPRIPSNLLKFDLQAEFQKVFPFSIMTYAEFIAAFAMHALQERQTQTYDKPIDATLRKSWFKTTSIPEATLEQMFETVSFSLDDMPNPKDTLGYGDFEFLKDRPYFLFRGEMYMLDYEFALGKLESAVVWRVLRSLPKDKKEPWLSYWGLVFEEYVTWMFETYAAPNLHKVYPSPKYMNSTDQICDQVIICGDTAVLIEAKLATCAAADRYSGDFEKVKIYLEDKLVTKGVNQLLNAVKRLGAKGADVPDYFKSIKKIIPVIITRDDFGGCWGVNAYLNKRFKDQLTTKSHKGIVVTPLVTMNISCLERMMWVLQEKAFADVMEERVETDPTLRQPFDAAVKYVQQGAAPKLHAHIEAYKELADRLIIDFGIKEGR